MSRRSARRRERTLAFQSLFMLDVGQVTEQDALDYISEATPEPELQLWTAERVRGTWSQRVDLDNTIQAHLQNWHWDRVGRVERSLMRLAAYEMLHCHDLPFSAAISEAVDLAKEYGDAKSAPFVNGVLDSVWRSRAPEESDQSEAG